MEIAVLAPDDYVPPRKRRQMRSCICAEVSSDSLSLALLGDILPQVNLCVLSMVLKEWCHTAERHSKHDKVPKLHKVKALTHQ